MSSSARQSLKRGTVWAPSPGARRAEWLGTFPVWLAYRAYLTRVTRGARAAGVALDAEVAGGIKLARRFTTGACLGWAVSRYLRPGAGARFHFRRGLIFPTWGCSVIASDHAADDCRMDRAETLELFTRSMVEMYRRGGDNGGGLDHGRLADEYRQLFGDLADGDGRSPCAARLLRGEAIPDQLTYGKGELPYKDLALYLARRLSALRGWLHRHHRQSGCEEDFSRADRCFRRLSMELFRGQLTSMDLHSLDERYDWGWYAEHLLNQKTLNFFLAPLALYSPSGTGEQERMERLTGHFHQLNELFYHWQILDDIRDLPQDLESGLATAPLLLLISQGKVAERLHELWSSPSTAAAAGSSARKAAGRAIMESRLLERDTVPWWDCRDELGIRAAGIEELSFGDLRPAALETVIRHALANSKDDLRLPLDNLLEQAVQRKRALRRLRAEGRHSELLELVLRSGAAGRFLRTVEDPRRAEPIRERVGLVDDPRLFRVLRIIYRMIHRAYRYARQQAPPEPATPRTSGEGR